jgi:uncharacterized membrane protein
MMMPANYSVIAENEMTYVEGGAWYLAPLEAEKAVNSVLTNVVNYIGNGYVGKIMTAAIGTWFSSVGDADVIDQVGNGVAGIFTNGTSSDKAWYVNALAGLTNTIGVLSGIYLLGSNTIYKVSTNTSGVSVKA